MSNLSHVIETFFPGQQKFDLKECVIIYAAIMGYVPESTNEIKSLLKKGTNAVTFEDLRVFFQEVTQDSEEIHLLEMFKTVNPREKCFVTCRDLIKVHEEITSKLSLCALLDSFKSIDNNGVLDYCALKKLYFTYKNKNKVS